MPRTHPGPMGRIPFLPLRRPVRTALRVLAAAGCLAACDSAPTGGDDWRLAWSDEFDGPAASPPAAGSWRYEVGTDWGNAQLEFDTDRTSNASLDGEGHLVITARREAYGGRAYTSARLSTAGLREFRYGRIEARMKLPAGQGLWPAFWMLGSSFPTAGWPAAGEIDVMEARGQDPTTVQGSLHGPGYSGGAALTRRHTPPATRFDDSFHVFGVEWTSDRIDYFVDGERFFVVRRSDVPGPWVFDRPFFIVINLAVGGTFVGPVGTGTAFPQTLVVDWVRVYSRAP